MNLLREKMRCLPMGAAAYFGGDSNSTTENKTEVRDMRVVGGDSSSNISLNAGDSSTTNVMLTDHGAVDAGMALGTKAIDAVVKNGEGLQQTTTALYAGALKSLSDSSASVTAMAGRVAGDLATAFTDSKAPDKSLLTVGGVVVLGLAAVMVFAAKKG